MKIPHSTSILCIISLANELNALGRLPKVFRKHPACSQRAIVKLDDHSDCVLTESAQLTDEDIISFMRDGHLQIRNLINPSLIKNSVAPALLNAYDSNELAAWRHKVKINLGSDAPETATVADCESMLKGVDQEDVPFMQLFNLWYGSEEARQLVLSPDLGYIAAKLLGVNAVRVYQDSLFAKRPGDGPTRWHSDLNMAPFDSNDFLTIWIPLKAIPSQAEGGSGLTFASGSHRDFALAYCKSDTLV